jgi:hypothetical protein
MTGPSIDVGFLSGTRPSVSPLSPPSTARIDGPETDEPRLHSGPGAKRAGLWVFICMPHQCFASLRRSPAGRWLAKPSPPHLEHIAPILSPTRRTRLSPPPTMASSSTKIRTETVSLEHAPLHTTFTGLVHPLSVPDAPVAQFRGVRYASIPARFHQSALISSYPEKVDATAHG